MNRNRPCLGLLRLYYQ